jgi:hypothetical protein
MKLRFGLQVCQFWVAARAKAATAFEKHSNCLSTSIDLVRRSEGGFDLCQPHVESRYLGLRILIKPHSIKPHSALFLLDYRLPYHLPCLHLHHFRGQRTSVLVFRAPASLEDEGGSASAFLLAFARPPFQSHSEIIFMWELLCEIRGVPALCILAVPGIFGVTSGLPALVRKHNGAAEWGSSGRFRHRRREILAPRRSECSGNLWTNKWDSAQFEKIPVLATCGKAKEFETR